MAIKLFMVDLDSIYIGIANFRLILRWIFYAAQSSVKNDCWHSAWLYYKKFKSLIGSGLKDAEIRGEVAIVFFLYEWVGQGPITHCHLSTNIQQSTNVKDNLVPKTLDMVTRTLQGPGCEVTRSRQKFTCILGFEAMRTLGGSPIAVAVPPMLEKMTLAIRTRTGSIELEPS